MTPLTQIGEAFVDVKANTQGFRSDLNRGVESAASGVEAEVGATVDSSGMRGEVTRATALAGAGQNVEVGMKLDSDPIRRAAGAFDGFAGSLRRAESSNNSFFSSIGRTNTAMRFLSNAVRVIGFGAIVSGASLAAQALVALGGGAVAAASSLSRLAGVAAALPGLLSAVAQGIASIFFATSGIGDALSAMGDAGVSGGGGVSSGADQAAAALRRQEDAAERVADATRNLERTERDAARSIARATERVADAKRNLADVAEDSAEDQAAAAERVQDAEEDLARAQEDAADRIADAKRRVEEASEDLARAEEDAADRIEDANDRVAASHRSLSQAQEDATRAQEDLTRARERAADRIEDLQLRLRQLSVDENQQQRAVERARRLLEANQGAEPARRQILIDQLEEEEIRLERIRLEQERANEEQEEFNENGIDGSEEVVSAQERLEQQLERLAAAERAVQEASEDRRDAQLDAARRVEEAQDRLARAQQQSSRAQRDAARRVADAQERLVDAQERVADAQEEAAERIADAEQDLARAREDAAEAQLDAQESVEDAQRSLERAIRDSERAMEDFGTSGAGGVNKVAEALSKLPKSAQEFAKFLFSLKPLLDEIRETAADNLFPGLTDGIRRSLVLFPIFRDAIGGAAKAIADLAVEGSKLITSPGFMADLKALSDQNVVSIRQFGTAGLNLTDALRNISAAAIPLVDHIGELAIKFSEFIQEAASTGRETGRLGDFFDRVADTLDTVIEISGNLIGTFLNVGKAASNLGDDLLESFAEITAGWEEFTGSVEGQNAMKEFFDDIRPTLTEVGKLVGAIASGFVDLARNPELAGFIRSLRTDLLPTLFQLFDTASDLGPNFLNLIESVVELLSEIATLPGLGTFIMSLSLLFQTITALLRQVPLLREFTSVFLTIQGFAAIGGLLRLAGNFLKTAAATRALATAFLFLRPIVLGIALAIGAPISAVVAIGLAIAGLAVLVVKHWDTIKEWTETTFNFIKDHIDTIIRVVVGIMTGGISELVRLVVDNWDNIRERTRDIFNNIRSFLGSIFGSIRSDVSGVLSNIRSNVSGAFGDIRDTITNLLGQARDQALALGRSLVDGLTNAANTALNNVRGAIGGIPGAIANIGGSVINELRTLYNHFINVLNGLPNALYTIGQNIVQGLINGVRSMGRTLINAILNLIPAPVRGVVARALGIGSPSKVFREFGVNIVEGLVVGLEDERRALKNKLQSLAGDVRNTQFESAVSVGPNGLRVGGANGVAIGNGVSVAGGINIQVRGILDPTDPLSARKMIQQIEQELRRLQEEKN